MMDFLEENPRIPHNKNELSLNCVPYDPTPLMLEELREQKKHLTEFLSHDQGTVDIITPLSPCLSGIHNPNPGNRDQGSRGTGCGVNLNPSSTYRSAPMKHLVTPRSLPQNNNNNTSPTCKGYAWLRTALKAGRSLEPHLPLFNILYELYVDTISPNPWGGL